MFLRGLTKEFFHMADYFYSLEFLLCYDTPEGLADEENQ